MAFRDDIVIHWYVSPRIIEVLDPSVELSMQDLVDTCREHEQRPENMQYPHLLDAAGKEDLGGGVLVGITVELQNAYIAFSPRQTVVSEGTATTADADGTTLKDSAATFETDGVVAGHTICNKTDNSVTSVIEVVSQTELYHWPLGGGTDNDWDLTDGYAVREKEQCEISGGNVVAVDAAGDPMSAVLPTVNTHVVRTSSSSATLQEEENIEYASFNGGVTVDATNGVAGTQFPTGTPRQPVDNIPDAVTIATTRGFTKLFIVGDLTIDTGDDISGYIVSGEGSHQNVLTMNPGADTADTQFEFLGLDGTLDGGAIAIGCNIYDLTYVDGTLFDCGFHGTITLSGVTDFFAINCHSSVAGGATPTLDCGGSGSPIAIRDYNGGLKITNKTGTDAFSFDMNSGQIVVDSTVTNGTLYLRGVGKVTDNSTGSAIVVDEMLNQPNIADAVWDEPAGDHTVTDSFGHRIKQIISKLNAIIGLS